MNPAKPWKNIHGAGQCVGMVDRVASVAEITDELVVAYRELVARELDDPWARRHAARI